MCPLCDQALSVEWRSARLEVQFCKACGHRIAQHSLENDPKVDYHEQYHQGDFVRSLERTRHRQAKKILTYFASLAGPITSWLDFGCGRGWFLETAQAYGVARLAGADTSSLALSWLSERGIQAIPCRIQDAKLEPDWPANWQAPQVISFLDVLEHFEPSHLVSNTRKILDGIKGVRWVVIKVPVSQGFLFRLANLFRRFGWKRPLEQMFQAGTYPPHFHYFSSRSLRLLVQRLALEERGILEDVDFDGLSGRLQFPIWTPRLLKGVMDGGIRFIARLVGQDARVVFASAPK